MKTVFLVASNGFGARNFFRTDILKTFMKNGIKCVLLFPTFDKEEFVKDYYSDNVITEQYRILDYKRYTQKYKLSKYLNLIRNHLYNGNYKTQTIEDYIFIKLAREKKIKGKFLFRFRMLFLSLLRKSKFLRQTYTNFESKMFVPETHKDLFTKYKPDAVIVSSTGTLDYDHYFMREAGSFGSKVITIVQSWDNPSSKGYAGFFPDLTFAWTDIMKKELETFLDIKKENILVGGVPHFDNYKDSNFFFERDVFFKKFNLDLSKKLIFYASRSPSMYPWNPEIIKLLAEAIKCNKFSVPVQLIVRVHPNHYIKKHLSDDINYTVQDKNMTNYEMLEAEYSDLHFNYPQVKTVKEKNSTNLANSFDINNSETKILSSLLKYSDVVVNLFSTINIEASIFDLPIVNIGFNGGSKSPSSNIRHNIKFDERQYHNQRAISTGAIKIARNSNQLINYIDNYLVDQNLDKEKRLKLKQNECGPFIGKSGKFIAEKIIEQIN